MKTEYIIRFLKDSVEVVKMENNTFDWWIAYWSNKDNDNFINFNGYGTKYNTYKTFKTWQKGIERLVNTKINWNEKIRMKYFEQSTEDEEIIIVAV